jgi:hypothetical protein
MFGNLGEALMYVTSPVFGTPSAGGKVVLKSQGAFSRNGVLKPLSIKNCRSLTSSNERLV